MLLFNYTSMLQEFEYNGKAMGTDFSVSLICESQVLADSLFKIAKSYIESYENKFSRFKDDSELSILNSKKEGLVSDDFINVALLARTLYFETNKIFNPLVSIRRLGYVKNFLEIGNDIQNVDNGFYDLNYSATIIDKDKKYIKLKENQELDFGGILKGYLAQIIAEKLFSDSPKVKGVIINLGGDIHTKGTDKNGLKFVFNIYNPVNTNNGIDITIFNKSLATSGTYKRVWNTSGKKVHHILDINGNDNPKTDIISASIICDEGATSEAYTKVLISLGLDKALALINEKKLSYIIIKNNGEILKNI